MKYIKHFSNLSGQTEYLNSTDIDTYLGYVDENDTVYYDDALPPHDYSKDYLTIESLEDNNTFYWYNSSSWNIRTISASTDNGATWTEYIPSMDGSGTTLATLNNGDKLLVKGENDAYGTSSDYNQFKSTGQFKVYGNIMSLISGDSFANADELTNSYVFKFLFRECIGLTSAENLVLPATATQCYNGMFYNCTSLTTAPELPATTLAKLCYAGMFAECTSLTAAPELPATTLAEQCYREMFYGCTSLTTAPELPATTLTMGCYGYMFQGCTNLSSITCLATDISANFCTNSWVSGVSSTGTFVKAASMTGWTTGNNGIPDGWTVQDA